MKSSQIQTQSDEGGEEVVPVSYLEWDGGKEGRRGRRNEREMMMMMNWGLLSVSFLSLSFLFFLCQKISLSRSTLWWVEKNRFTETRTGYSAVIKAQSTKIFIKIVFLEPNNVKFADQS